jgi:arginase
MPYELGRLRDGVGRGPERLVELGAEEALAAAGVPVRTEVVELAEEFSNEVDASFELVRLVAARVRAAVRERAFPVVLSGSCFAAVGVVAGLDEWSPGVVWFDAHADFNSPETTISGYFDGMGLAVLTGGAWQGLLATVPGARPVPETAVVLAGARDFDEPEERRLEASDVAHLSADSVSSPESLLRSVAGLRPAPTGLYLHVDLDVLDIREAHVNVYSVPDGLSAARLESLVAAVLDEAPVRAVSLTAYDPRCDVGDRVPPIARRLLGLVAEHVAGGSPDG